ncbi:MAG: helix-turn-helix transcriptional regulator [Gammaproteobacteria bacterium]|nr:helix-turn-helix transcriptional regulator [Gammaproteobacteria bacterium]
MFATLGAYLKNIREISGDPHVVRFAVRLGISPQMIYQYENNATRPGFDVLTQYVNAGAEPDLLLRFKTKSVAVNGSSTVAV